MLYNNILYIDICIIFYSRCYTRVSAYTMAYGNYLTCYPPFPLELCNQSDKHIHKIHHEWQAPIGLVSLYAHPFEHVVSNLFPVLLGPMLCGSHVALLWVWFHFGICTTINTHCGYHFPGLWFVTARC